MARPERQSQGRRPPAAWIDAHPLACLLALALALRLLAAFYARGYGMHDDHFAVIEIAQRWLDGHRDWLDRDTPHHKSLLYPGLHFALFWLLERAGLLDPQAKMLVVRLLHAAYSLLTVGFGFQLARKTTDETNARLIGLLLAAFWAFPFLSVRNLIEFVCVPPLVIAYWFLYRDPPGVKHAWWAGLFMGLALALRFQVLLLAAPACALLLCLRGWRRAAALLLGCFLGSFVTLGLSDWLAYGKPYVTMVNNLRFNTAHRQAFTTGPVYRYLFTLVGVLLPPLSFLLLLGAGRTWRRHPLIFWPVLAFFAAHSLFPHKQERFLLPVLPLILILGVTGWTELAGSSPFWTGRPRLLRGLWMGFWVTNTLLLAITTMTYSKRVRVEVMCAAARRGDATGLIVETGATKLRLPLFYLGKPEIPVYYLPASKSVDSLRSEIRLAGKASPNYAAFLSGSGLEEGIDRVRRLYPDLTRLAEIRPSFVDALVYRLNPRYNVNQTGYLYRIGAGAAP